MPERPRKPWDAVYVLTIIRNGQFSWTEVYHDVIHAGTEYAKYLEQEGVDVHLNRKIILPCDPAVHL